MSATKQMTDNYREIIDACIFNFFKHKLAPNFKLGPNMKTRWIGNRNGESFYDVRYFITSTRFTGGVRHDRVGVRHKDVRIIHYDDFR